VIYDARRREENWIPKLRSIGASVREDPTSHPVAMLRESADTSPELRIEEQDRRALA